MALAILLIGLGLAGLFATPAQADDYNFEDNAIAHARKGELLMGRRRYGEAIEEFKIALRLNPYSSLSATAYNNLGISYLKLRNYPLALTSFQRAIRIQPNFELYYKNLIRTYQEQNSLRAAQERLKNIVAINPEDAEAWYLLGLAHQRMGFVKEARDAFSRFVELQPNSRLVPAAQTYL